MTTINPKIDVKKFRLHYELDMYSKGAFLVAGLDEVGRGPLAGPLVTGAVVLNREALSDLYSELGRINDVKNLGQNHLQYSLINDSKKLAERKRVVLNEFIIKESKSYSIVEIQHSIIDKVGISQATQIAFYTAITKLDVVAEHFLTDNFKIKGIPEHRQTNIPKGDSKSISIAAASIIAKVHRDNLMIKWHEKFPKYNFAKHKGYGTKEHLNLIKEHGPCEIHRKSFKPISNYF